MNPVFLANFDAFKTDEIQNLSGPMGDVTEFFQLFYIAEMRVAIFCAVIAVVVLGIYFIFKNKAPDIAANKAWAVRIVVLVLLLFCIGNLISMVWDAHM